MENSSIPPNRLDGAQRQVNGKAKLALSAILQNVQALEVGFATKAVNAFREAAKEVDELGFDDTTKVLRSLDLTPFIEGGDDAGLPLGAGEEWQRLWRLWKSDTDTVEELCFLWLAWRAHRFCDPSFVKEIAWPLFQTLDMDDDDLFTSKDLNEALTEGDGLQTLPNKEAHSAIDLYQLMAYHAPRDKAGKWKEDPAIGFPSFLAWICDAQDLAALRKASLKGPIECVVRFESGVVFMRPQDLGAFVKKEEEEDFDAMLAQSNKQQAALQAAKNALQEARMAKEAADAAKEAVQQLSRSHPGTPNASGVESAQPSFGVPKAAAPGKGPLNQSLIEEAPAANAPQAAAPGRLPLNQSLIEEAPAANAPQAAAPGRTAPVLSTRKEAPAANAPQAAAPDRTLVVSTRKQAPVANAPQVPLPRDVRENLIEEAPPAEMQTSRLPEKTDEKRPANIHISVKDINCHQCGNTIKSDSNFCRHCGLSLKGKRNSKALKVDVKARPVDSDSRCYSARPPNPRYCALDADTENLVQVVATPMTLRKESEDEEWEESACSKCKLDFPEKANFCSNCGTRRGRSRSNSPRPAKTFKKKRASMVKGADRSKFSNNTRSHPRQELPASPPAPSKTEGSERVISSSQVSNFTAVAVEQHNATYAGRPAEKTSQQWTKICINDGSGGKGQPRSVPTATDTGKSMQNGKAAPGSNSTLQKPGYQQSTSAKPGVQATAAVGGAAVATVVAATTMGNVDEEDDMESYWEEEEEEEGDFEDDPVVEPPPAKATQAKNPPK